MDAEYMDVFHNSPHIEAPQGIQFLWKGYLGFFLQSVAWNKNYLSNLHLLLNTY